MHPALPKNTGATQVAVIVTVIGVGLYPIAVVPLQIAYGGRERPVSVCCLGLSAFGFAANDARFPLQVGSRGKRSAVGNNLAHLTHARAQHRHALSYP